MSGPASRPKLRGGRERTVFIRTSNAEHQTAGVRSTEEIAMKKKRPTAKHGLFGESGLLAEHAGHEFFEARVAGYDEIAARPIYSIRHANTETPGVRPIVLLPRRSCPLGQPNKIFLH
jgi:hypothetical protein